jgi:ABC-2 type transport system ATP-binding protein
MEVNNVKALARVLDGMNIDYQILSDTQADVFAKINVSKMAAMLQKETCEIISMQEHDESLESYYISLVGGEKNA